MDLKPKENAQSIQKLLDAGCIIIGKANLSVRGPLVFPFSVPLDSMVR